MNKKELKATLSNFSMTAGAQLKYYIIKSLYPDIKASEIEVIGGFNSRTFPVIRAGVEEKGLAPLCFISSEEAGMDEMDEAESAELIALKEENERLKNQLELKIRTIQIEDQTIKSREDKIANLKDFIRKSAENRETMIQYYQQTIERLQEQGIDLTPLLLNPYKKEMKELLE